MEKRDPGAWTRRPSCGVRRGQAGVGPRGDGDARGGDRKLVFGKRRKDVKMGIKTPPVAQACIRSGGLSLLRNILVSGNMSYSSSSPLWPVGVGAKRTHLQELLRRIFVACWKSRGAAERDFWRDIGRRFFLARGGGMRRRCVWRRCLCALTGFHFSRGSAEPN